MMNYRVPLQLLVFLTCLTIMVAVVPASLAETQNFTITTQVTAGQGWIDTVGPTSGVPLGAIKHFRIKPERGQMIADVQIDGQSIGPVMFATIPLVSANHVVSASFTAFDQTTASDVSSLLTGDARILLIGPSNAIQPVKTYLDGQIAADGSLGFNVTVDTVAITQDLLLEYYANRTGPTSKNALLNKIAEGWDYIIPFDLYDYQALLPELHLEGVRLIHNRAWFEGGQARLILPMLWYDTQSGTNLDAIAGHTYRIGNGFRIPVLPAGIAWRTLVQSHGQAESQVEFMSPGAAYTFACLLFAQFFEKDVSTVGYSPPDISGGVKSAIESVAWATWQAEKTNTHYSGAYTGVATPFNSNTGRGYHFGTSTRVRSVDRINALIAAFDPAIGNIPHDSADGFDQAASGGAVQNNLASQTYAYMWRQWKGENTQSILDVNVRGQFNEDPYFIWYQRYMDQPADTNAANIGLAAFLEARDAYTDNTENVANNPNSKSRAPQTHIGWGRVWEERTDIQMMEDLSPTPAHAHDVLMSMFAAQTYALLTGRDASLYGTWGYDSATQADLVEKSGYARRVGFETIMQLGALDIHQPYNQSVYDIPVFNEHSIFPPSQAPLAAGNNTYLLEKNQVLSVPAPGILSNDYSAEQKTLTAIIKTQPVSGTLALNLNGSFVYTPTLDFTGDDSFTYAASDGDLESNVATVTLKVVEEIQNVYLPLIMR
jgi:hypothetical protein